MSISNRAAVVSFLLNIKYIIQDDKCLIRFSRPEYIDTASQLGIDQKDVIEEIKSLSVEDYFRGPSKDRELKSGDVWEFGKQILGHEVYIKLVLKGNKKEQWLTVLSFHFPKFKITYPFRKM